MITYILLIVAAIMLVILEIRANGITLYNLGVMLKRMLKKEKSSNNFPLEAKVFYIIDNFMSKTMPFSLIVDSYSRKLNIFNPYSQKQNSIIISNVIFGLLILLVILMWLVSRILFLWVSVLIISILTIYVIKLMVDMYINNQMKKIHNEFPAALQIFIDEYVSTRNIKASIVNSYNRMPEKIQPLFEKLARKFSSGYEYQNYIREFADELGYVWGYAFAEVLLVSYQGVGDVYEELLYLNQMTNESIKNEAESASEMASGIMLFYVIHVFVVIGFLGTFFLNPIAKELYLLTVTGNLVLAYWIFIIVMGLLAFRLMQKL